MNYLVILSLLLLQLSAFAQLCYASEPVPTVPQTLTLNQGFNPLNLAPDNQSIALQAMPNASKGQPEENTLTKPTESPLPHPEELGLLKDALPPASTAPLSLTLNAANIKKAKESPKEKANVYLNFENSSLASILNYLAEEKKFNILPNKELENVKVSLSTRNPLTLERAWTVFLTLLEMNNFSIVKVGDLHRVVTSKENGQHPLPTYTSKSGTNPEDLPDSDLVIRYVYFFNNMKPDVAKDILGSMLEGDQSVQISQDLQACIIKEKCFNIKAAMQIIKELDTGGLRESIKIYQLKETNVDIVHKVFEEILGADKDKTIRFALPEMKKDSSYFSSDTKIIPYPAKNSLILLGTEKNLNKIVEFIKNYLDVEIGSAQSRIHIKEIRYAKAESLKPILENSIKPPSGQATDKSILVGKYKFFDDVIISAEEAAGDNSRGGGNRLIIAANNEDWKRLEAFIDKLDKPQPQVAFEVIVIDVEETQNKELGAQIQNKEGKTLGMGMQAAQFNNLAAGQNLSQDKPGGANSNASDTTATPPKDVPPLKYMDIVNNTGAGSPSFLTLGRTNDLNPAESNIWAIIRSRFATNNTHIVSQPYLIVNNSQACNINVSESRQINGPLQTSKGEPNKTTKTYANAGTQVSLTPQINYDGVVNLDIDIKIDEFQPNKDADPTTITRNIKTKTSMLTGEVLVLGGLKKTNVTEDTWKTPILGDIPFVGTLFKSTTKSKVASSLYVFIRPSIIKPRFEGAPDEYTQLKLDYAKYQLLGTDKIMKSNDPIQRWFFKTNKTSLTDKATKARDGRFDPIDNFAHGKFQPRSVDIKEDPYFKVSESIEKVKKAKLKHRTRMV